MKRKGFTLVELLICISAVVMLAFFGVVGYVVVHFLIKFW